ncbi:MAG: hypothetical protein EOO40_03825, partial [Deltaproteobacteria bacterium]
MKFRLPGQSISSTRGDHNSPFGPPALRLAMATLGLFALLYFIWPPAPVLMMHLDAKTSGQSELFYRSADRAFEQVNSSMQPLRIGDSIISYQLPSHRVALRWDPAMGPVRVAVREWWLSIGIWQVSLPLVLPTKSLQMERVVIDPQTSWLLLESLPDAVDPQVEFAPDILAHARQWQGAHLLFLLAMAFAAAFCLSRLESFFSHAAQHLERWVQRERPTLAAFAPLLTLSFVCHLYRLAQFAVSIDDEYSAARLLPTGWVTQGRWGN